MTDAAKKIEEANGNALEIGQVMKDGTVYAGISPITRTDMFAMPKDSGRMTWNQAIKFTAAIEKKDGFGFAGSEQARAVDLEDLFKDDGGWRMPTLQELNHLYENKKAIGGFENDWYWSLLELSISLACVQHFGNGNLDVVCKDGTRFNYNKDRDVELVRCVRTLPRNQGR